MEIEITGNVQSLDFEEVIVDKLDEIMTSTAERLMAEQDVKITGAVFTNAQFTLGFNIEGMEEPQLLTVEHHEGIPEMFKWVVDVDEDTKVSNEEKSAYDAWTVAKAKGEELEFEPVESLYNKADLKPTEQDVFGNMTRTVLSHKDGFKVSQVRQNGHLIQEYKMVPRADADAQEGPVTAE